MCVPGARGLLVFPVALRGCREVTQDKRRSAVHTHHVAPEASPLSDPPGRTARAGALVRAHRLQ